MRARLADGQSSRPCPRLRCVSTRSRSNSYCSGVWMACSAARAAKLDVFAVVELHRLEDLEAPCREVRLEIRRVAPPDRLDAAHVHARRARRDVAALEQDDAAAVCGEMPRRGGAGDAAADDENFGFDRGATMRRILPCGDRSVHALGFALAHVLPSGSRWASRSA